MKNYRGRFAPTPSGPLHFGSLFAAVVSYLDAKKNNGKWLVRIDDIDPLREQDGASTSILNTLEAHGLYWDEPVTYQSQQSSLYEHRLNQLNQDHLLYWCNCSRKDLAGQAIYPGYCRQHLQPREACAIRINIKSEHDRYHDIFQGEQSCNPKLDFGDVILKRKDNLYAYQLAVTASDIDAGITNVVRGIDLIDSTWWQRALYAAWHEAMPEYGHFAVIHNQSAHQKLSKQNLATAIVDHQAITNLMQVFNLLSIPMEPDRCDAMLNQAAKHYHPKTLANQKILYFKNSQMQH